MRQPWYYQQDKIKWESGVVIWQFGVDQQRKESQWVCPVETQAIKGRATWGTWTSSCWRGHHHWPIFSLVMEKIYLAGPDQKVENSEESVNLLQNEIA